MSIDVEEVIGKKLKPKIIKQGDGEIDSILVTLTLEEGGAGVGGYFVILRRRGETMGGSEFFNMFYFANKYFEQLKNKYSLI